MTNLNVYRIKNIFNSNKHWYLARSFNCCLDREKTRTPFVDGRKF